MKALTLALFIANMLMGPAFGAAETTIGDKAVGISISASSSSTGSGGNCANVDTAVPSEASPFGMTETQRWNLTLESLSGTTDFPVKHIINGQQGAPVDPLNTNDPKCPILGYVLTDVQSNSYVKLTDTSNQPNLRVLNSIAADLISHGMQLTFAMRGVTPAGERASSPFYM